MTAPVADGVEDYAPMTPRVVEKTHDIARRLTRLAAIELVVAAQAVDLRDGMTLGRGTRPGLRLRAQRTSPGSTKIARPARTSSASPSPSLPAVSARRSRHERRRVTWAIENYDLLAGSAWRAHRAGVGSALVLSLLIAFPLGIWTARRPRRSTSPP